MHWYVDVLKQYAVFEGRAGRREYWMYTLFTVVVLGALYGVGLAVGTQLPCLVYLLAVLLPSLAVTVRRLHDIGKSGWFVLVNVIPLIGGIIMLAFVSGESEPGQDNKYGQHPRYVPATA